MLMPVEERCVPERSVKRVNAFGQGGGEVVQGRVLAGEDEKRGVLQVFSDGKSQQKTKLVTKVQQHKTNNNNKLTGQEGFLIRHAA